MGREGQYEKICNLCEYTDTFIDQSVCGRLENKPFFDNVFIDFSNTVIYNI